MQGTRLNSWAILLAFYRELFGNKKDECLKIFRYGFEQLLQVIALLVLGGFIAFSDIFFLI